MFHLGDIDTNVFNEVMIFIEDIGEKIESTLDSIIATTNIL